MRIIVLLLVSMQLLAAQTFEVVRKKRFWPDGKGQIHVTDEALEFKAREEEHSRRWAYQDIQYFDRVSEKEFILLSYEDQTWKFGRDRQYRFVLTSGEISDEIFRQISERIGRPVTNRVVQDAAQKSYELPAKHLHSLGGCEGRLVFTPTRISYATERRKDAREWLIGRDIESVWSMNPYQLELHVFDNNRREFSKTKVYKFDLKQPLDQAFYRKLKLRLYELEAKSDVR